ncbi:MAG: hypothetical protein QM697_06940 [Lachnospiraceae bacterium]
MSAADEALVFHEKGDNMVQNGMISAEDTAGKYIFWDIDGTLAAYRYNGHLADPSGTNNGTSLSEIEEGIYLRRQPSRFMQKVVADCHARSNIIMGHCRTQKEMDDKQIWLDRYYPIMQERLITFEDQPKYATILNYCRERNICLNEIIFVDDRLQILWEAERHGILSYHISSFLDWFLLSKAMEI